MYTIHTSHGAINFPLLRFRSEEKVIKIKTFRCIGTLSGEATLPFLIFFSVHSRGRHLEERICSSRSKFFSLSVDPIFKGFFVHGTKLKVKKVVSFIKLVEKT